MENLSKRERLASQFASAYICPYCSKQRAALKRAGGVYVACAPCKSWFRIA